MLFDISSIGISAVILPLYIAVKIRIIIPPIIKLATAQAINTFRFEKPLFKSSAKTFSKIQQLSPEYIRDLKTPSQNRGAVFWTAAGCFIIVVVQVIIKIAITKYIMYLLTVKIPPMPK
jgi:hypothetical protein